MTLHGFSAAALAALLCGAVGGCGGGDSDQVPQVPLRWAQVTLAPPAAGSQRPVVRDAIGCADKWYVVGASTDTGGGNRPSAWHSLDGATWRSLPFTALPTSRYGAQSTIYTVACRGRQLAMVGASSGGVHGNPRVSTWRLAGAGAMTELDAPFELYGGPEAVNVARIAAGPTGFAIAGNRTSGAAVWLSGDAAGFRLVQHAPGLAGTPEVTGWAHDVAVSAAHLTVVGAARRAGRPDDQPAAWRSVDGAAWTRSDLPDGADGGRADRVIPAGDELVAVGTRGATFGCWRTVGGTWQAAGRFGGIAPGGIAEVRSLTAAGRWLVASVDDGATHGVWLSSDGGQSWATGPLPVVRPSGAGRSVLVAGLGSRLLLVTDDGRAWTTEPAH